MHHEHLDLFRRFYVQDYTIMTTIMGTMTNERVWQKTPEGVSLANLMCHVCEMERYWLDFGICREAYARDRDHEFTRSNDLTTTQLVAMAESRMAKTLAMIAAADAPLLAEPRSIHGETLSGYGILIWHTRHLGLHRGHIQAHARWLNHTASA